MSEELAGSYQIKMVLPAWTVENTLTLCPRADGVLDGTLDTGDGCVPFTHARWNGTYFHIALSVGPGQLLLTGSVSGGELKGVVIIDDTPDCLCGTKLQS